MSVYDSVDRNVSSRVRKVVRDGADVTSGGRQLHTWGPATEKVQTVRNRKFYICGQVTTRKFCSERQSTVRPGRAARRALELRRTSVRTAPFYRTGLAAGRLDRDDDAPWRLQSAMCWVPLRPSTAPGRRRHHAKKNDNANQYKRLQLVPLSAS